MFSVELPNTDCHGVGVGVESVGDTIETASDAVLFEKYIGVGEAAFDAGVGVGVAVGLVLLELDGGGVGVTVGVTVGVSVGVMVVVGVTDEHSGCAAGKSNDVNGTVVTHPFPAKPINACDVVVEFEPTPIHAYVVGSH